MPPLRTICQIRARRLQPPDAVIVERGNIAVFLRAQAVQPSLARMDDEDRATRARDRLDEVRKARLAVLIVDADAAFHGDRQADGGAHRRNAVRNQRGLGHQARAETPRLHPVRRAADIQIDFVIAEFLADPRRRRQLRGSLPPICRATGCSAGSKPSSFSRFPCMIAAEVTISV